MSKVTANQTNGVLILVSTPAERQSCVVQCVGDGVDGKTRRVALCNVGGTAHLPKQPVAPPAVFPLKHGLTHCSSFTLNLHSEVAQMITSQPEPLSPAQPHEAELGPNLPTAVFPPAGVPLPPPSLFRGFLCSAVFCSSVDRRRKEAERGQERSEEERRTRLPLLGVVSCL